MSNNISCIWIEETKKNKTLHIGFSNIDVFTGNVNVYEFETDYNKNPCSYDLLEQTVNFYCPSEYILIHNIDPAHIKNVIQFVGLHKCQKSHVLDLNSSQNDFLKEFAINAQKQIYQHHVIYKFYESEYQACQTYDIVSEYPIAGQSLIFLYEFVESQNPTMIKTLRVPQMDDYGNKCYLANHSAKQLNIVSEASTESNKYNISNILNMCRTNMGKRKFNHVLMKPTRNIEILLKSYSDIDMALRDKLFEQWEPFLSKMKDMEKLYRKAIISTLTPSDFCQLHTTTQNVHDLILATRETKTKYEIEDSIFDDAIQIKEFIEKKFNLSQARLINHCQFKNKWSFNDGIEINDGDDKTEQRNEFINSGEYGAYDEMVNEKKDLKQTLNDIVSILHGFVPKFEKRNSDNMFVKISHTPSNGMKLTLTKKERRILRWKYEIFQVSL